MTVGRRSGEQHTRQGVARGQKYGTLDRELEGDPGGQWAATSHTGMKDQGRVPPPATTPRLQVIAGLGCWCGQSYGHDWPGKATGAPHPRT